MGKSNITDSFRARIRGELPEVDEIADPELRAGGLLDDGEVH